MHDKACNFRDLHIRGNAFIMANAWNSGSAVLLEEAGFKAIGTTSAGIAFSRAVPDYVGDVPLDTALEETRSIVRSVEIPVSMDAENGYGHSADAVSANMVKIAATGVAGASIEDHCGEDGKPLYDIDLGAERIQAAREATGYLGYPFTLTARAECYLTGHADPFRESVRRLNRYREAGADCLFVPGIRDVDTIRDMVREVDGPLNVVMGLSGKPVSVAELRDAGVARISIGGSLARATFGLVRAAAREMLEQGTFEFAGQQIADAELCALFSAKGKK